MKRILITSTDVMMYQFLLPHVYFLYENGYIVDVACSYAEGYQDEGYHTFIRENLPKESTMYSVSLARNPYDFENIKGLNELRTIMANNKYDVIWTNEPVMGVMTRLAAAKCRKSGTKVLYMAHGYHFFKGAPKKNWIYYPVEKIMSRYCDAMCMINWEDYEFTHKHMPSVQVYHIDGIGFDSAKYERIKIDKEKKRKELGFNTDDIILLSVGELQTRKNHEPVLRAIAEIDNKNVKYVICGWGELREHLLSVAEKLGLKDRFFLLGHRYDIPEILKMADIFIHPSLREGLGIAALEAMSAGLPIISSNVQGLKDFIQNGRNGFVCAPSDINSYRNAIEQLLKDSDLRAKMSKNNIVDSKKYDIQNSREQVLGILNSILGMQ